MEEANALPWSNFVPGVGYAPDDSSRVRRAIDPTLVADPETGVLHCFFVGTTKKEGAAKHCNLLGHATCVDLDLKIWEMRTCNAPLMGAEVHEEGVENISILKEHDGTWTMILSVALRDQHVAYCRSSDLCTWTPAKRCKILPQPFEDWMAAKHGAPSVWVEECGLRCRVRMALMGEDLNGYTSIGIFQAVDFNMLSTHTNHTEDNGACTVWEPAMFEN